MTDLPHRLDLRGMRCPWPAIRVARAIREARGSAAPVELLVLADDPAAAGEIEALASEWGWCFFADSGASGAVMRLRSS